jgi:CubicO group peptidase (beta-lactamase class C family)
MGRVGKPLLAGSVAVVALMLMSGCGSLSSNVVWPAKELEQVSTSSETVSDLVEKVAGPSVKSGMNVGLVIGVINGEHKATFSFGKKSRTSDEAPDGDTIFAIGSITKAFLSLLAYQLVQEGTLSLSDNLGNLLPTDSELSDAAKKITIGQLLTHSSGLPRQPNDLQMLASLINYTLTGENIYRHIDADKVFETLREFDPDPEEVGAYRYSNIGSGILGRVIELKTKKPLQTLLNEKLLERIGAKDTAFHPTPEQWTRLATGHVGASPFLVPRNTPMNQWDMGDILTSAAGLYSTLNDLLKLAQYRIALGNPVVDVTPIHHGILSVSSKPTQKSSLGWSIDDFDDYATHITFMRGMISGYSAYVGVDPQRKLGVVVLANNFDWDDHFGHNLLLSLARKQMDQQVRSGD